MPKHRKILARIDQEREVMMPWEVEASNLATSIHLTYLHLAFLPHQWSIQLNRIISVFDHWCISGMGLGQRKRFSKTALKKLNQRAVLFRYYKSMSWSSRFVRRSLVKLEWTSHSTTDSLSFGSIPDPRASIAKRMFHPHEAELPEVNLTKCSPTISHLIQKCQSSLGKQTWLSSYGRIDRSKT